VNLEADLAAFRACSDATRLRLLFLLEGGELCVCELVAALRMPQGKVSRHLAVLKQAGLVRHRREGAWVHYSLSAPETPLGRRLRSYLRAVAKTAAVDDRARLEPAACRDPACLAAR
jgi:ArsR family transcriptional regulator, arsenate/arsenite/antimonite-responsive transcriptional repressor